MDSEPAAIDAKAATPGRVQHVSLVIRDEAESRVFYTEVLGLKEAGDRPKLPMDGLWLQVGDMQIHLLVPPDLDELPRTRRLDRTPLAPHTAFEVPALGPIVERLRSLGVEVIFSEYVDGQAFLMDPSGNVLELNAPANAQ